MGSLRKTEINTDVVQWLNKKTESSSDRVVLLEGFCYMLRKLKLQGSVRLTDKGMFHQRFWKSLDRTLNYMLYPKRKKNRSTIELYQFYYSVSRASGFIETEKGLAKITEKGVHFLGEPYEQQLDFLLSKLW